MSQKQPDLFSFNQKHLLGLADYSGDEIRYVLDQAKTFREVLDRPRAVERLDVEPGYVRVRYAPRDDRDLTDAKALRDALVSLPSVYNDRHATAPDLDGFAVDSSRIYMGSYRPADAAGRETVLAGAQEHADVPEADGPVFEYVREEATLAALSGGTRATRAFGYEFTFPFDVATMYGGQETGAFGKAGAAPVRWGPDAVREALAVVVEKHPNWPGHPENIPRIAVYPTHATVEYVTKALADPLKLARRTRDALLYYNRYRRVDEDRTQRPQTVVKHSPIAFDGRVYVDVTDHGETAAGFIEDHGLDAVDGEPVDPEPEPDAGQDAGDAGESGRFDALNPFG